MAEVVVVSVFGVSALIVVIAGPLSFAREYNRTAAEMEPYVGCHRRPTTWADRREAAGAWCADARVSAVAFLQIAVAVLIAFYDSIRHVTPGRVL